jgi:hypothetical protein
MMSTPGAALRVCSFRAIHRCGRPTPTPVWWFVRNEPVFQPPSSRSAREIHPAFLPLPQHPAKPRPPVQRADRRSLQLPCGSCSGPSSGPAARPSQPALPRLLPTIPLWLAAALHCEDAVCLPAPTVCTPPPFVDSDPAQSGPPGAWPLTGWQTACHLVSCRSKRPSWSQIQLAPRSTAPTRNACGFARRRRCCHIYPQPERKPQSPNVCDIRALACYSLHSLTG